MMIAWFSVTLRCNHPDWDPASISSELGMQPRVSWRAGERRRTPDGQVLDGQYPSSYWCSQQLKGSWDVPSQALIDQIEMLESKRAFIKEFIETGGRIEFFLGWGLPGRSGGQVLDSSLMGRLGALGIDLSIDVYARELEGEQHSDADHSLTP